MKVLYIQDYGDFASAYDRLIAKSGKENYYGQKYSVDAVVQQARRGHQVRVLVTRSNPNREVLEDNLSAVELDGANFSYDKVEEEITAFAPDLVILRSPDFRILRFLRKNAIETFPVLADSFENIPWFRVKTQIRKYLLGREMRHKSIKWIANHQINAAMSVQKQGVKADKILPYDWKHDSSPAEWTKTTPQDIGSKKLVLFYAGGIYEQKGIFDLIEAVAKINAQGRECDLKMAGRGTSDALDEKLRQLGLTQKVQQLGLIDHDDILKEMNSADAVIVPSHHAYPEGLPMTIMESLMVRTPVIASDHPMFVGRVGNRGAVSFFKEKDAKALCDTVLSICSNRSEYEKRSSNASAEWHDLVLELKWADMINMLISDPNYDLSEYSLKELTNAKPTPALSTAY